MPITPLFAPVRSTPGKNLVGKSLKMCNNLSPALENAISWSFTSFCNPMRRNLKIIKYPGQISGTFAFKIALL